jgi:4-amino-4-deoxy-L-arabinose transferase-like glycosyltransferase
MQIMLGFIALFALVVYIIYKVNKKFEKKEFMILLGIVVLMIIGYILYEKKQETFFPNLFQEKYLTDKNIAIEKLSYELLNNKNISSRTQFIYKFVYIIQKDEKEYLCTAPKVEINKIGDEFVFSNFNTLQEECIEK